MVNKPGDLNKGINTESNITDKSRREFLHKAGLAIGGGAAGMSVGQAVAMSNSPDAESAQAASSHQPPEIVPANPDYSTLRYDDNFWARDTMARIQGDLEFGKQKFGWYKGTVRGIRPNEKNRVLFGFEGFSYARLEDNGNGTYNKLLREVGYYTDLETGKVMDHYDNPYTGERVPVVHIANDPFNYVIGPYYPKPPNYGGLNEAEIPDIPMRLPFQDIGSNTLLLQSNIDLFYPSALQPEKWPRESPGPMTRVTEMFNYVFNKNEVADPSITGLYFSGAWNRITPWLPWMLMDQGEGHIHYDCVMGCYPDMGMVSPEVLAYAEEHHPTYFNAPTEWEEPSLSSLEHYALEQTPAPVKE